jgi:hypothetical protein
MRLFEQLLGIMLVAVVLYYIFNGNNSNTVINSLGQQSVNITKALMAR